MEVFTTVPKEAEVLKRIFLRTQIVTKLNKKIACRSVLKDRVVFVRVVS